VCARQKYMLNWRAAREFQGMTKKQPVRINGEFHEL